MLFQESEIREREDSFYKNIIRLYLTYGSVDEVFKKTRYDLPISYPGMHHLIRRWGIVKSVGPNSKLSENRFQKVQVSGRYLISFDWSLVYVKGVRYRV